MSVNGTKIKVGIIRGGVGNHYASSLRKGGDVISHIVENLSDKYKVIDILIDKDGVWHLGGLPIKPADLVHKVDIVWDVSQLSNMSTILGNLSIPYIGNSSFQKALVSNNDMLRAHVGNINIQMPKSIVLPVYQEDIDGPKNKYVMTKAKEILHKFPAPWIIKSFTPDSNMGIHLAKTFPELIDAIEDGIAHEKSILVEEFISGKLGSVHSISGFRGTDIYTFPLINIFGVFSTTEKEKISNQIRNLHKHLGVEHYLKSDFVLHPKKGIFLTGIYSLPDLKKGSHFDQSCEFVGAKMSHVSEHILNKALNKKA